MQPKSFKEVEKTEKSKEKVILIQSFITFTFITPHTYLFWCSLCLLWSLVTVSMISFQPVGLPLEFHVSQFIYLCLSGNGLILHLFLNDSFALA